MSLRSALNATAKACLNVVIIFIIINTMNNNNNDNNNNDVAFPLVHRLLVKLCSDQCHLAGCVKCLGIHLKRRLKASLSASPSGSRADMHTVCLPGEMHGSDPPPPRHLPHLPPSPVQCRLSCPCPTQCDLTVLHMPSPSASCLSSQTVLRGPSWTFWVFQECF